MVKKSQRIWIILVGLFIALAVAFVVPRTSEKEAYAASTFNPNDDNPRISSVNDLISFYGASAGGNDFSGKTVTLNADIDCAGEWMIGSGTTEFKGVFDGNGYTVKNLDLFSAGFINKATKSSTYSAGSSGVIKNLTLENFSLNNSSSNNVGGICGYLTNGQIVNCKVKGGSIIGQENTGGICGYVYSDTYTVVTGLIRECDCTAAITGDTSVGGIIGCSRCAEVDFCNYGKIGSAVNSNATVKQKFDSSRNSDVGGIVGFTNNPSNSETYITNIQWCANYGTVTSDKSNSTYIGGIIGRNTQYRSQVNHCCNLGAISGTYSVGGIMGYDGWAQGTIHSCFNAGTVTLKSGGANWGQILGNRDCSDFHIYNCFFDVDVNAEFGSGKGNIAYDKSQKLAVSGWSRENFSNGWVATYLNGNYDTTEMIGSQTSGGYNWQQSLDNGIGPDTYPTPSPTYADYAYQRCPRGKVYNGYWCNSFDESYSNYELNSFRNVDHPGYNNGFCTKCGKYQACSGNGTSESPYLIDNAGKLYWFSAVVNNNLDKCAVSSGSRNVAACGKLTGNIDLNLSSLASFPPAYLVYDPIGHYASGDNGRGYPNSYRGKFDGNNKTISNLTISTSADYQGLFGHIYYVYDNNSEIKDLTLQDVSVTAYQYVGAVCGYNTSVPTNNCHVVKSSSSALCSVTGYQYTGGMCGYIQASMIDDCSTSADIMRNAVNAYSNGYISIGGIAGGAESATISNSYSIGNISVTATHNNRGYVGGLIGELKAGSQVNGCYATGNVSTTTNYFNYSGGLIGNVLSSNVTNCYAMGNVSSVATAQNYSYAGGLCAHLDAEASINNCYAIGDVSALYMCGRLVADNGGTVSDSYSLSNSKINNVAGAANSGENGQDPNKTYPDDGTQKISAKFAGGEVTYLLNSSTSTGDLAWYQSIDNELSPHDAYPLLNSERGTVYRAYRCGGDTTLYYTNINPAASNNDPWVPIEGDHIFDNNGFCTRCGVYEAPTLSSDNYYEIDNAGKLYWFAAVVNNELDECENPPAERISDANAKLTADINVNPGITITESIDPTTVRHWTPIGTNYYNTFNGNFDGDSHTISGFYVNSEDAEYVGLIGYAEYTREFDTQENKKISNVGIENSYLCSNNKDSYVGGICGCAYGYDIENCYNTAKVSGCVCVGGICNSFEGKITNCYNVGDLGSINKPIIGSASGICGISDIEHSLIEVENCYNYGNLYADNAAGIMDNIYIWTDNPDYPEHPKYIDGIKINNCYCKAQENVPMYNIWMNDVKYKVYDNTDSILDNLECMYWHEEADDGYLWEPATLISTRKDERAFNNFEVKDSLQSYVDSNISLDPSLLSWAQGKDYPIFTTDHTLMVNVSWGDMKFAYKAPTSLDPTSGWSIDTDENKITFENHSNGAKLRYNDVYGNVTGVTGTEGLFTHEEGDWTYQGNTWPMVESPDMIESVSSGIDKSIRNSWLTISGTISGIDLNDYIGKDNAVPIGQITITISG